MKPIPKKLNLCFSRGKYCQEHLDIKIYAHTPNSKIFYESSKNT